MPKPRLIALDLDGTLLDSHKALTERTRRALERAAAAGIEIVPSTGRFYDGMPACIRELPFIHYGITINGAGVVEVATGRELYKALIPLPEAVEIMAYLDPLPLIYDCYQDNWGYMTADMRERCADYAPDAHYIKMIRELRKPVPELKAWLLEQGVAGVQKVQLFTRDDALRFRLLEELPARFEAIVATTSVPNNLEINHKDANKGQALTALAAHLNIPMACVMAIGDGLNDLSMIQAAGIGVAMSNACDQVLRAADQVTGSCDEDGVAQVIEAALASESLRKAR